MENIASVGYQFAPITYADVARRSLGSGESSSLPINSTSSTRSLVFPPSPYLSETTAKTDNQIPKERIECTWIDCDKTFSNRSNMNRHVKKNHNLEVKVQSSKMENIASVGYQFAPITYADVARRSLGSGESSILPINSTSSTRSLVFPPSPYLSETTAKTDNQIPKERIECTWIDCDKTFSNRSNMNRHVKKNHNLIEHKQSLTEKRENETDMEEKNHKLAMELARTRQELNSYMIRANIAELQLVKLKKTEAAKKRLMETKSKFESGIEKLEAVDEVIVGSYDEDKPTEKTSSQIMVSPSFDDYKGWKCVHCLYPNKTNSGMCCFLCGKEKEIGNDLLNCFKIYSKAISKSDPSYLPTHTTFVKDETSCSSTTLAEEWKDASAEEVATTTENNSHNNIANGEESH